jgi:integrase
MQTLRKFAQGRWYECRPASNGTFYVHWTEGGRSKRKTTGARSLDGAQAFLDEWCSLIASPNPGRILTCADLWPLKYPPGRNARADDAWKNLFLWLALHTAARRTAIQELRWDQVDFDIDVIHYLPDGAVQSRKRKASVPISETLKPVLEEAWRRRLSDTSLVIGSGGKINEPLRLVAEKAGVAGVTPHVMRHTAATIMARNGVSIWVIAQVLGNTVEQVEKVYAKWTPDKPSGPNMDPRPPMAGTSLPNDKGEPPNRAAAFSRCPAIWLFTLSRTVPGAPPLLASEAL